MSCPKDCCVYLSMVVQVADSPVELIGNARNEVFTKYIKRRDSLAVDK